eukprot:COSAG01_NODE_959_length_12451_cov_18.389815_6_plen_59_part_00
MVFGAFYASILELVSVWAARETEDQFETLLQALFDQVTSPVNGHNPADPDLAQVRDDG